MKGEFIRTESRFRGWVTASEGAEHSGHGDFPAAPGRYHLYVSYISAATNPSILPASCPRGPRLTSCLRMGGKVLLKTLLGPVNTKSNRRSHV